MVNGHTPDLAAGLLRHNRRPRYKAWHAVPIRSASRADKHTDRINVALDDALYVYLWPLPCKKYFKQFSEGVTCGQKPCVVASGEM